MRNRCWSLHFYTPVIENGGIYFVLYVIRIFCPSIWNFNLPNNCSIMSARALLYHMSIPCGKTFPWVLTFFTLDLAYFYKTWSASAKVLIFYINIHCDCTKPFNLDINIQNKIIIIRAFIYSINEQFCTGINVFVLVNLAIFGIGHYRAY
mgnify:CR=1 FL=1